MIKHHRYYNRTAFWKVFNIFVDKYWKVNEGMFPYLMYKEHKTTFMLSSNRDIVFVVRYYRGDVQYFSYVYERQ